VSSASVEASVNKMIAFVEMARVEAAKIESHATMIKALNEAS
jgi:hypothetical protein